MKPWLQVCTHGARSLLRCTGSFALWTLWLGLSFALCVQLWVAASHELAVPDVLLRRIEARLADAGLRPQFGRTSFDPTGRILIEDLRLLLPGIESPVVTARSVYLRLKPFPLSFGRLEPDSIEVTGVSAFVPALYSTSGTPHELVRGLDVAVAFRGFTVLIRRCSGFLAEVPVTLTGSFPLPAPAEGRAGDPIREFFSGRFPEVCREAMRLRPYLDRVEGPALALHLGSAGTGTLALGVEALVDRLTLDTPAVQAARVRARTLLHFPSSDPTLTVAASVGSLALAGDVRLAGIEATVVGRLGTALPDAREISLTVDRFSAAGAELTGVAATLRPQPASRLDATINARVLGDLLTLRTQADLAAQTARVAFVGAVSPRVLDVISARVGTDVRRFYDFDSLRAEHAEARFGPGWKFAHLAARVHIPRMNSYGVIMEDGHATVELEPGRFWSPDAFARIGDNYAQGTYEHDLRTHDYRFLLAGRLRPLEISAWFREWWPNFFRLLEFTDAPPEASVEVAGSWRDSRHSRVFVFADAGRSVIRGTPLDRVRTRLFIRPSFFDGFELLAERGEGTLRGRFTHTTDPVSQEWRQLDLNFDSTLGLDVAARFLGPEVAKPLEAFRLSAPPTLRVTGRFPGPAAPAGTTDLLHIAAETRGDFAFHRFPLTDVSFKATLEGDSLVVDDFYGRLAGGTATGRARVWGRGADRRVGFDVALADASFGGAVGTLQTFFAAQKDLPPPEPGKFVRERAAVRVDLGASAEGRYDDALSFKGDGSASLRGAEIGEVPLLGLLSELLKFTSLRFTDARANFKIDGPRLLFPKVELRGANSAIDASGEVHLDRRDLAFNAKIYPFSESDGLIKSVVGAVLTPLSSVFEVKLSGTLDKPTWTFANNPINLFRGTGSPAADSPAAPAPGGPPAPGPAPLAPAAPASTPSSRPQP